MGLTSSLYRKTNCCNAKKHEQPDDRTGWKLTRRLEKLILRRWTVSWLDHFFNNVIVFLDFCWFWTVFCVLTGMMEKTHQQSCNKPELSFIKPQNYKIFCKQNKLFPLLQPRLPSSVDPQDLTYLEEQRYYIIPDGVRPVMKTFRIEVSHTRCCWHVADVFKCFIYGTPDGWICEVTESWRMLSVHFCVQVLFWGLRELKRVELFEVSRPFVKMECAGRQLESEEIENFKTHPNFKELVRYIDVVSVWLEEMLIWRRIMANFLLPVFLFLCLVQSETTRAGLPPPSSDVIRGGASGIRATGSGRVLCGSEPHGLRPTWARGGARRGGGGAKTKG